MVKLDRVTLHMSLCSYYSSVEDVKNIARRCKNSTVSKHVHHFMNMVINESDPVPLVREMAEGIL